MAFEQEIYIEEKLNPFSVWFDPSAKEYDRRDGMFAFEETEMSRETYEAKYPDKPLSDWNSNRNSMGWFSEHKIRIVRYWVKKPVKKTIVLLSNGKTVEKDEQFARLFPHALSSRALRSSVSEPMRLSRFVPTLPMALSL